MLLPQLPTQTYLKVRERLVELPQTLARVKQRLGSEQQSQSQAQAKPTSPRPIADYEVLIIGAGVSGIDMACHLQQSDSQQLASQRKGRNKKFIVVEKRADLGGTWDLFKYPGIRSDSDMFTFGFANRPWLGKKTLTDGESIKQYIKQTAQEAQIESSIRFYTEVKHLAWSSHEKVWTATLISRETGLEQKLTANFVIGATGYYDYDNGYEPTFKGQDDFQGQIIHPQHWQEDTNYHDKKVVIIGSGATAVTLMPALVADKDGQRVAHVTMLQRSPSYIATVPSTDDGVDILTQRLNMSQQSAYTLVRWKNILTQQGLYQFSKAAPKVMKSILTHKVKQELKGSGVSLTHFTPDYNPWDERLCAVPDGDLFAALQSDRAAIVTDEIERFTESGIRLKSGKYLEADIVVTATGLNLQMLGGATVSIDGEAVAVGERMTYKAVLIEDVPNMAMLFGYTNASWTLKIDLACDYVQRLLHYMHSHGYHVVTAQAQSSSGESVKRQPDTIMGALSAGYIQRAKDTLPKQGDRYPWLVTNNYLTDRIMLKYRSINDEWLSFER